MSHTAHRARGSVVGAGVLWATSGVAARLAVPDVPAPTIALARMVVGGATLGVVAAVRPSAPGRPGRRGPRHWLVLAAVGLAGYQVAYFAAAARVGVAATTVVAGLAALWGASAGHDRSAVRAAGRSVSVAGTLLAGSLLSARDGDLIGLTLAMSSGLSYLLFAAASKRHTAGRGEAHATVGSTAVVVTVAGALLVGPGAGGVPGLASASGALAVVYLGVVTTAVAYALFTHGLARLPAHDALRCLLVQPFAALVLGALVLAEPVAIAGVGVAIVSAVPLWFGARSRSAPASVPSIVHPSTPVDRTQEQP